MNEIEIHVSLDHRYVVKLYRVFRDDQFIYLVLELCENKVPIRFHMLPAAHSSVDADGLGKGAKSVERVRGPVVHLDDLGRH